MGVWGILFVFILGLVAQITPSFYNHRFRDSKSLALSELSN